MAKLPIRLNKKLAVFIASVILFINGYFFILSRIAIFQIANLKTLNILCRLSHSIRPLPPNIDKFIIISIDDKSMEILKKKIPWDRTSMVELLDILPRYQPRTIALDVVFFGESREPIIDDTLAYMMNASGNVIIASYFKQSGEYITSLPLFSRSVFGMGFINKPRDRDIVVRNARAAVYKMKKKDEVLDYSFEIKTLCSYLGLPLDKISLENNMIFLRNRNGQNVKSIPVSPLGILPIQFRADYNDFNVLPLYQVLFESFDPKILKDKIVIAGFTTEIYHDIYPTPLGLMSGPALSANELLMLLNDDFVKYIPQRIEFLIMALVGLLTALITYRLSPLKGFYVVTIQTLLLCAAVIATYFANWQGRFFDWLFIIIMTYLAVNIYKYLRLVVESIVLKTQAVTDELTGLYVYRYFKLCLQSEWDKAKQLDKKLTLVMADIDYFKKVNDTYGHNVGNIVLKEIAQILIANCRKSDTVCRYGGEEFAVIMANMPPHNAFLYAERVRKAAEGLDLKKICGADKVTISLGIATFPDISAATPEEFIECADKALYEAKQSGRNRVCVYSYSPDKNISRS